MSKHSPIQITCPKCGKNSEFLVWQSLNTDLDPDMKEKLMSKELFRFVCPHCGEEANTDYGILYHQMADKIMIYYVQDEESFKTAIDFFNGPDLQQDDDFIKDMIKAMDGYLYRIVLSQNDLIEKIRIFDDKRDDRIIELMKVMIMVTLSKDNPELKDAELYYDNTEKETAFVIVDEEGVKGVVDFQSDLYDEIHNSFVSNLPDIRAKGEFLIDVKWAVSKLTQ